MGREKFISNDIAAIYPRREALVRDILVDIWDEVRVWDTLAILFNTWVQGEWQSKINIKKIQSLSKIDSWFLEQIKEIVDEENKLQKKSEPPTYFQTPPLPPKVNHQFTFFFTIV